LHARVLNLDAPGGADIVLSSGEDAGLAGADLSDR
jgi:hypothetical protein